MGASDVERRRRREGGREYRQCAKCRATVAAPVKLLIVFGFYPPPTVGGSKDGGVGGERGRRGTIHAYHPPPVVASKTPGDAPAIPVSHVTDVVPISCPDFSLSLLLLLPLFLTVLYYQPSFAGSLSTSSSNLDHLLLSPWTTTTASTTTTTFLLSIVVWFLLIPLFGAVRCWFLRFFVDSVVMCLLVDWVERLPWKFKTFPVRGLPSSA